jgi:branched-subunit amino acid transport protein AzlD
MSQSTIIAIAALFVTSCLVRVLPVFINLQLGGASQRYLERVLPVAVFINFAVYIVYMEAQREPAAAFTSLGVVAAIGALHLFGLVTAAGIGTIIYFMLVA